MCICQVLPEGVFVAVTSESWRVGGDGGEMGGRAHRLCGQFLDIETEVLCGCDCKAKSTVCLTLHSIKTILGFHCCYYRLVGGVL